MQVISFVCKRQFCREICIKNCKLNIYILLRNNHLGNTFADLIAIKVLFDSAKPSAIANCRGEFRGLALINDWENNIAYEKNPSKARPWLLVSAICFMLHVNS